ncbi:hypothetical protein [Cryobacterium sp. BB736]|uniref:hypothetical protein n=1 Tax=Cryobacterium sp. BB736 TaxID=2746963 RepID=UPI0018736CE8|nr:hypothetical protein [Cryobacterium sp. BB736]
MSDVSAKWSSWVAGVTVNGEPFTANDTGYGIAIAAYYAGWDAAKADMPDRKEALVDLLYNQGLFAHLIPEFQADSIHELAEAILALLGGEA